MVTRDLVVVVVVVFYYFYFYFYFYFFGRTLGCMEILGLSPHKKRCFKITAGIFKKMASGIKKKPSYSYNFPTVTQNLTQRPNIDERQTSPIKL